MAKMKEYSRAYEKEAINLALSKIMNAKNVDTRYRMDIAALIVAAVTPLFQAKMRV